ncbi:hypothetical protein IODZLFCR_CDS0020 [Salmonella phage vB_SalP_SE29]|uniref:Uncharacterized protein n=1 Tax=Salmonella phage vB_SalP_SE29 TaxID=3134913 RepID=A0AAX4LXG3_9CAUD
MHGPRIYNLLKKVVCCFLVVILINTITVCYMVKVDAYKSYNTTKKITTRAFLDVTNRITYIQY